MKKYFILTLFPDFFASYFSTSLVKKGLEKSLFKVELVNIRDFTTDKFLKADDYPFGGLSGLVMKAEPIIKAFDYVERRAPDTAFFYPSPRGEVLKQRKLLEISEKFDKICFLCGHYKGIDERVFQCRKIHEISVGDYVLNSGEVATIVMLDGLLRLIPGFIGNEDCIKEDSITSGLIEAPNYTRPRNIKGQLVPEVLLSGNHKVIERWRLKESFKKTLKSKPYLLLGKEFCKEKRTVLKEAKSELIKELYSGG